MRLTQINVQSLAEVRQLGAQQAAIAALDRLLQKPLDGFWIYLDVNVLIDTNMPAVDYRMPDGLSFEELSDIVKVLVSSPKAVGLEVTIFNPTNASIDYDQTDVYACYGTTLKKVAVELFRLNGGKAGYYLANLRDNKYNYCGLTLKDVKTTLQNLGIGLPDLAGS